MSNAETPLGAGFQIERLGSGVIRLILDPDSAVPRLTERQIFDLNRLGPPVIAATADGAEFAMQVPRNETPLAVIQVERIARQGWLVNPDAPPVPECPPPPDYSDTTARRCKRSETMT